MVTIKSWLESDQNLWSIEKMKYERVKQYFSKVGLYVAIKTAMSLVETDQVKTLTKSMVNRQQAVIENKGHHI